MITRIFSAFGFALLLMGCGNTKKTTAPVDAQKDKKEVPGTNLIVNSFQAQKPGDAENTIVFLTQQGDEISKDWEYIHQEILGFEYEPGYIYKIKVTPVMEEGKPKLKLVEQYSKERDQNYFLLHNIWVLTELHGEAIEITDKRPSLQFYLNSMKVSGNGTCNQVFTHIEKYTSEELQFGAIGGTKMMCDQLKLEREFMTQLEATQFYTVSDSYLVLLSAEKKEILRFKRVD